MSSTTSTPGHQAVILYAARNTCDDQPELAVATKTIATSIAHAVGREGFRPGFERGLDCEVRQGLLAAWRKKAQDPDYQVEAWFQDGGPMGGGHRAPGHLGHLPWFQRLRGRQTC